MRLKLLLIAVLSAFIFTAVANTTIGMRNNVIVNPLTISLKGNMKHGKAQAIPTFNQTTTQSKIKAVNPISTLPYVENFDNADITTDGWLISDPSTTVTTKMGVGSLSGLASLSGSSYLISGYDASASRNAWAFSPALSLMAGVTYHVYIYAYAPGYNSVNDEFKVTVGTDQTSATQTTVLIDKSGTNSAAISDWTKYEATFTPSTSGNYNFAVNHCTVAKDVDAVAFENFVVSDNVYVEPPIVHTYTNGGLWSATTVFNDSIYLPNNQAVNYVVKLMSATSFSWSFDASATASSTTDSIPSVTYSTSGNHTATLNASGPGGNTNLDATYTFIKPTTSTNADIVYNFKSYDAVANYTFSTNNYLMGPNTYYKKVAEKYSLPSDATVTISQIYLYVGAYTLSSAIRAKTFTIQIVKADGANGLPGTVASTVTPTYSTLFGTTAISTPTMKTYTYTTPVTVTGSFYIVLDFTNVGTPSASNFVGLYSTAGRSYTDCSLFMYYSSAWTAASDLVGDDMAGFIAPKLTFQSVTAVENPKYKKLNAFISEKQLYIQDANEGENLIIYDLTGYTVFSKTLKASNEVIPVSLNKGVYLVKVADKIAKVMVN